MALYIGWHLVWSLLCKCWLAVAICVLLGVGCGWLDLQGFFLQPHDNYVI